MKMQIGHTVIAVLVSTCLGAPFALAEGHQGQSIGLFTAAQGNVTVSHPGSGQVQPVNVHDEVLFHDVIETQHESRTKAFFEDDSILTVGENSKVEITEYVYDPEQNTRRTVVKLLQGQLRALVSKVFSGSGSKFEIHTPPAVAAARGTYFVVWVEEGTSGIANIGNSGRVAFTSGETEIIVDPGRFSTAGPGEAPSVPRVMSTGFGDNGLTLQKVEEKIQETEETEEKAVGRIQQTEEKIVEKTQQEKEKAAEKTARGERRKQASILAKLGKAIEGTMLKDTPKRETVKDAIRAFRLGPPVSPLPLAIARSGKASNDISTGKRVSEESDAAKRKQRQGDHESDITKRRAIQNDGEAAVTAAQTVMNGSGPMTGPAGPAASVIPTGAGPTALPATPSVNSAPTTVMSMAPAAPTVAVAPAAPVVSAPMAAPVAPAVKVTPTTPPPAVTGALKNAQKFGKFNFKGK